MSGKMKHKSRSRKTYKPRMRAASVYLNNYSMGRTHARNHGGSRILAWIKAMKQRKTAKAKARTAAKPADRKRAAELEEV